MSAARWVAVGSPPVLAAAAELGAATVTADPSFVRLAPEIADAKAEGRPIVALESTIIAHGLPCPQNLALARDLEAAVRAGGAVPATIAVADGVIRVGLDAALLERLATEAEVRKLSRRDLAACLASRRLGATTVASTMIAAHLAGIRVFATGGIGGVHRGAETSFDVSADLPELARTPVVVVSAGAKAILDLPKTLEWLETRGVPVLGYRTDAFPAFWSRDSGCPVPLRVESAREIAAILALQDRLGFANGILVANPISEEAALPRALIERAIAGATAEAGQAGIAGRDLTPWLLARIAAATDGRSVVANLALVLANARLAAEIAVAVAPALRAPWPRAP